MARYARYSSGSIFIHDYFPPGVKWLLIVNTVIFVLTYLSPFQVQRHIKLVLALSAAAVVRNLFVWQLLTYMFLHGNILHILFNLLTLWFFGAQSNATGHARVSQVLLLLRDCGGRVRAGGQHTAWRLGRDYAGIERSDLRMLVAFAVMYPNQIVRTVLFPIKAKYLVMIYVAVELLLTFGPKTASARSPTWRSGFRFSVPEEAAAAVPAPDIGGAYRQWKLRRAKRKFQTFMRKRDGRGPWVS